MSLTARTAKFSFQQVSCEQCQQPVPFIVHFVNIQPGPPIAQWPAPLCPECVVAAGVRDQTEVTSQLATLQRIHRLLWLDDPEQASPVTLFNMEMLFRDIPGGAKYGHLRATAIGMTVSGLPSDLHSIPVPSLRWGAVEFLFPLVEISSQRHVVRRRQVLNLVTGRVQTDLINVDKATQDQFREMRDAGALLNEYVEKRGRHQHSRLPLTSQQVREAILRVRSQGLRTTQSNVIGALWPEGYDLSERQFRERLREPELFPDKSWPQIVAEIARNDR
jgi:hypothetical protein